MLPPLRKNLSLSDWLALRCGKSTSSAHGSTEERSGSGEEDGDGISLQPRSPVPLTQVPKWKSSTRPLTLLPLIAIIFYNVCGGPFGIEVSVVPIKLCATVKFSILGY